MGDTRYEREAARSRIRPLFFLIDPRVTYFSFSAGMLGTHLEEEDDGGGYVYIFFLPCLNTLMSVCLELDVTVMMIQQQLINLCGAT